MSLQFDQLNNELKVNDSSNANASLMLTPSGTGSVLLDGTGQNFYTQSSSLTNGAWAIANLTVTGSQSDPFGGTTAALLTDTTTPSVTHSIRQTLAVIGTTYTLSVYAKAGTSNYIGLANATGVVGSIFNLTTGAVSANWVSAPISTSATNVGNGWWRLSIVISVSVTSGIAIFMSEDGTNWSFTGTGQNVYIAAPQFEFGSTANAYTATTSVAIYNAPQLSFSGVAGLGLQSDGSLYVQPAGVGAIQAQPTTSTTVGGNARGANATDWQTLRSAASRVASGSYSTISGGQQHTSSGTGAFVGGGYQNTCSAYEGTVVGGSNNSTNSFQSFIGGGQSNVASGNLAVIAGGQVNTAAGYYNFIGGGYANSGTANGAVTTQSATMNGTTAVTLSGSNANIKVGQLITGSFITFPNTFVAAISGTSLTLSQTATGSGTATLSFFTPFGTVVSGGNNQATGSYSFIGGGGDAGTAANRNVASGDWSVVAGGFKNTASGVSSVVCGGGGSASNIFGNSATNTSSFIGAGQGNSVTGSFAGIMSGSFNTASATYASCGAGQNNLVNAQNATIFGGAYGTVRSIAGFIAMPAHNNPISTSAVGYSQAGLLVLGRQTTDATATALTSDTSAAGTTNQVILPNNSAYYFRGEIVSGVTGGGNTKGWTIEGVIKRGANAAATTLVGSTVMSSYADVGAATWTIALAADTTNGGLAVTFTGQAATTIRTVCQIRTTEMTY
jgi:hypothetical protein